MVTKKRRGLEGGFTVRQESDHLNVLWVPGRMLVPSLGLLE